MILFLLLARHSKIGLAICAFCLVINLAEILPWYLPVADNSQGISGKPLRVLVSNVYYKNQDYPRLISLLRQEQPDLAVFAEINDDWLAALDQLKDIMPYSLSLPKSQKFGVALYSKLPLENPVFQEFAVEGRPSIVATVTVGSEKVTIIGTHILAPINFSYIQRRNQQLGAMSRYLGEMTTPKIVFGDLNITMWSHYYKEFVKTAGMRNARAGFGVQPTWYKKLPIFYLPIDHCLVSPDIQVRNSRVGSPVGSDHRPIIVDLTIPQAIPQRNDRTSQG
jgi:endonuclease/exonuclease/phosphatase (EEP) superfamily protein YafD